MEEQKKVLVIPTPGVSFEEDMAQRDEAAATAIPKLLAVAADVTVQLHANLSAVEIRRAIKRWTGQKVNFVLVESDSTASQRKQFIQRWKAAGGTGL